eukprot:gene19167-13843_t
MAEDEEDTFWRTAHLEIIDPSAQGALSALAERFQGRFRPHMQYAAPLATSVAGRQPVLFVFPGPPSETIDHRPLGGFWNSFKGENGDWLDSISLCDDILRAIKDHWHEACLESLEDVYLTHIYPHVRWQSGRTHELNEDEKRLAIEWFHANVHVIDPKAIVIFSKDAEFASDGKDVLNLNPEEGGADISSSPVSPMKSLRIAARGFNASISVECHRGHWVWLNGESVEARMRLIRTLIAVQEELNGDSCERADAIVDSVLRQVFNEADFIVDLLRARQEALSTEGRPHKMTLKEIQRELANAHVHVSDATLRGYLEAFVDGAEGRAILYDLLRHDNAALREATEAASAAEAL